MNKEHYRLEALKLAVSVVINDKDFNIIELANDYYDWIMQDYQIEQQAKQEEENKPNYKVRPNQ